MVVLVKFQEVQIIEECTCCPAHSRGSCHPVGVLIMSGPCLLHWEHVCHIGNMFVTLGTHLSSCLFQRFMPSCGGSCCIGNVFTPPLPFQSHSTKSDFGFLMDSPKLNQQVSSTESESKRTQIHQIHSLVSVIYHL